MTTCKRCNKYYAIFPTSLMESTPGSKHSTHTKTQRICEAAAFSIFFFFFYS
uniref:Uncharacterized protein n=1 Tax=Arundo donax TaxID=35708 RepID=A0A0A9BFL7_ARUDO